MLVIGIAMIAMMFVALFVHMVIDGGLREAIIVWAIVAGIAGWVVIASALICIGAK